MSIYYTSHAYGMAIFPAQDSVLSADALADLLRVEYGLAEPVECRFFRKGICDTYYVKSPSGEYYLKIYRAGRRKMMDVSEEVRLLLHLLAAGVRVARPVARQNGCFLTALVAPEGVRHAVLFEAAIGAGEETDDHRRAFGAAVARMHLAADAMDPPYRRRELDMEALLWRNMEAIRLLMAHRRSDYELIRKIAVDVARHILTLPRSQPYYGVCHGDLHGGDVRYSDGGEPTLLDFDSSGCGWRAVDIGVYLCHDWMNVSQKAETKRQGMLSRFLEGYGSVRKLGDDELEVIQLVPALHHIFLMGHVLRNTTIYSGWHWADDDFLNWHMTWFKHWARKRDLS